jgi:Uma2 family endonuclease
MAYSGDMATVEKLDTLSVAEYLALEARSDTRHEYVDGVIYAMVGGSVRHNLVASTVLSMLRSHLRKSPCRVYMSDMKVQADTRFYYPDVMVSCGDLKPTATYESAPVLIVEVLSESTEAKDRLEKLVAYQSISSLTEYVLIAQDKMQVEIYLRDETNWSRRICSYGDTLRFESIEFECPIEQIYEDVVQSLK